MSSDKVRPSQLGGLEMKKATVADALSGAKPKTLRGPVVLVIIIAIGIALWATGTINQWLNYPPENRIGAAVQLTISGPLAWRMNGHPMPDPMDVARADWRGL